MVPRRKTRRGDIRKPKAKPWESDCGDFFALKGRHQRIVAPFQGLDFLCMFPTALPWGFIFPPLRGTRQRQQMARTRRGSREGCEGGEGQANKEELGQTGFLLRSLRTLRETLSEEFGVLNLGLSGSRGSLHPWRVVRK